MTKQQFEKGIQLLNQALDQGESVIYTGKSLNYLINHFSSQLIENWTQDDDIDKLLPYWEGKVEGFKAEVIESAKNENSFASLDGFSVPLVRETIALKIIDHCPPPPEL